jgi:hypothetical protein
LGLKVLGLEDVVDLGMVMVDLEKEDAGELEKEEQGSAWEAGKEKEREMTRCIFPRSFLKTTMQYRLRHLCLQQCNPQFRSGYLILHSPEWPQTIPLKCRAKGMC